LSISTTLNNGFDVVFSALQDLIGIHRRRPILKALWALGILTIIVFSIIYIEVLFDFVRDFEPLRLFARRIKQLITQVAEWDKVSHFAAYALVAFIGFFAVSKAIYRIWIAAGMVAMGITLEIIQLLVPGRDFEFYDWFADVLGVAVAYALFSAIRRIWRSS
jgi:VanZ family protein